MDPSATQADDLTQVRLASLRQAARAKRDPVRQSVDGTEPEEGPGNGALPEEDECRRLRGDDPSERLSRCALEGLVILVLGRDPEPGGADCPLSGRYLRDRAPHALVSGHDRACEHRRQHRGSGCDPGRG